MRSFANQTKQICFIALISIGLIMGAHSVQFSFNNKCSYQVWPATLSAAGSPAISTTGFAMDPGATHQLDVPAGWSGRLWARTGCSSSGTFTCVTGDCGTGQVECNGLSGKVPATLVEMTLNANNANKDTYDISLVDGFNLPLSVVPQSPAGCTTISCQNDVNAACPDDLKVMNAGQVVGCMSACAKYNTDEYCCRGAYSQPGTCKPSNYSMIFKNQCPQAYSYAYNDGSSTFTCDSGSGYTITFCP